MFETMSEFQQGSISSFNILSLLDVLFSGRKKKKGRRTRIRSVESVRAVIKKKEVSWHLIYFAIFEFKLLPDKNTEKREKKSRERQRSEAKNSFMADHDLR